MKKLISLCLSAAFLFNAGAFSFDNWSWGDVTKVTETVVAPGATYSNIEVSSPIGPQKINALEFDPKSEYLTLRAGMSKGYVNGTQTVAGMAADFNEKGEGQVVAGINGDYFNMTQGVPFGIFMEDGEIFTTPPQYSVAFGIKKDGTPFCQSHGTIMNKVLIIDGVKTPLSGINNRHSEANSLMLYNDKFDTSTKSASDTVEILCEVLSGEFRHGETLSLMVSEIYPSGGNTAIPEGKVVLSARGTYKDLLQSIAPTQEIEVLLEFNEFWSDVDFAIAGNYLLLKDGEVQDVSGTERSPRSVIGIKEDGNIVFYTIDGRMSGYSVGATYKQAATIMKDLGCVDAINLDGGGSTTFVLRPLGEMDAKMINRSADVYARAVANGVLLVNTAPVDKPTELILSMKNSKVLLGGAYTATVVGGIDENYLSYEIRSQIYWDVDESIGEIAPSGLFTPSATGTADIIGYANNVSGEYSVTVLDEIDEIIATDTLTIKSDAKQSISVTLKEGGDNVSFSNDLLTWEVEGDIGTFTAPGEFTAGPLKAEGLIKISHGDTVKTIAVTIDGPEPIKPLPFTDMEEHIWAKESLSILYNANIINGVSEFEFAPARSIKRADFILMLLRLMEIEIDTEITDQFEDVLPGSYYYNELATAKRLGIAKGTSDTTFAPERHITREEMFTLTWRVMNMQSDTDESVLDSFGDKANISPYATSALATLVSNGLVAGDTHGNLNPRNGATRAEAAVFLARVYTQLKGDAEDEPEEVSEPETFTPSSEPTI